MGFLRYFQRPKIQEEVKKPIGVALFTTYTSCMGLGTTYMSPITAMVGGPGFNAKDFHPFYEIDDQIEDNIKVNGCWQKREDVFLFKDKTTDELILYKRGIEKKYGPLSGWTDIHQLYNNGLTVGYGLIGSAENHFHDKKLERKINQDMAKIVNH